MQAAGFNDLGLTVEYAPELAFSGTVVNKAWADRNQSVVKRALAAHTKGIEWFYDEHNRAEAVRILVAASGQKVEDVEKSYDFFAQEQFLRSHRTDLPAASSTR